MHKPFRTTKEEGKADNINFYRAHFIKPKEMRHNADQEKIMKKVMEIRRTRRLRRNSKIYFSSHESHPPIGTFCYNWNFIVMTILVASGPRSTPFLSQCFLYLLKINGWHTNIPREWIWDVLIVLLQFFHPIKSVTGSFSKTSSTKVSDGCN